MLWLYAAILQCIILLAIWRMARKTIFENNTQTSNITLDDDALYPTVAMIIPAAGNNPVMHEAISSLLTQNYPHLLPIIVTADKQDPATQVASSIKDSFPTAQCLIAGEAAHCSQKNHNILFALSHVKQDADIFVFCDSSHIAKPDFISQLVWPIINGEAGFTTGYHEVEAYDDKPVTLAYQFCVLLMRLLQAIAIFTQPWGGAMAISRQVFEHHKIVDIWRENVVDDCSLASLLLKRKLHVKLCPKAILTTKSKNHSFETWCAWMQRQILFLKFCIPTQWYCLGFFSVILALPILLSCIMLLSGLTNMLASDMAWFVILSAIHLGILTKIILSWRELLPRETPTKAWLTAFVIGFTIFAWTFFKTIRPWFIDWHGKRYNVTKGGRVINIEKLL